VEVIDLRTVCPFDEDLIFESVAKTGRLVVADTAFRNCGVAGEIAARVVDKLFGALKSGIRRVTLPDVPTPTSWALEALYYPDIDDIVQAVKSTLDAAATPVQSKNVTIASGPRHPDFHGPF